ncbi:MAG: LacI family transcriptional regulator, partial [Lentisphaerae bacterium]
MNLLDEIAARAGVSPSTVSRALSGKHNPQRKAAISRYQKICDIARQLGYRPNAAARAMASKERQTLQLGILHYNPETAIFTNLPLFEMFLGVQQVMQQHQVNLNFVTIHNCDDTPWVFTENWLEGIIVAGVVPPKLCERIRNLFQHVVWLDTNVQEEVNCVLRDEELAGRMAATALIEAGATQIIWLSSRELSSPTEPHYSSPLRFRGVCTVAQNHNIPLVIGPITQPEDMTPDFWQKHLTPTTGVVADYHYLAQALHNLLS